MKERVIVMVDGETVSTAHAAQILQEAVRRGALALARAYGDLSGPSGWQGAKGFHNVDAGAGPGAAPMMITIDAMEFAFTDVFEAIVIASSNGIFVPLVDRLSRYGTDVTVMGGPDTPQALRAVSPSFVTLPE